MLPLQVEEGEHDGPNADVLTVDHSRRHNVECTQGGDKVEGRRRDGFHSRGVRGRWYSLGEGGGRK